MNIIVKGVGCVNKHSQNIDSNFFKKGALQIILGGVALFSLGIFVGYQVDNRAINSIQGFLFNASNNGSATDSNATDSNATDSNATDSNATDSNATDSNATDSNATDSNATDSNATDSNATDSNATDSNATSGNAQATDNILYLQSFELSTLSAKKGDKVNITLSTTGSKNSGASIVFKNNSNGLTFTASVKSIGNKPYIVIPDNVSIGKYDVVEVMLVGTNSDNSTFSRRWSSIDKNADYSTDFTNKSITIVTNESEQTDLGQQTKITLENIALKSSEANVNDKVNVDIKTNIPATSIKLTFNGDNGRIMVVYVKSLEGNSYFEVPSTTIEGNYNLVSAVISSDNSTIIYSIDGSVQGSERFTFNSVLKVNSIKEQNKFVYNNEDLTNDIIRELYNNKGDVTININADTNPIINDELFNAVKGTNKKLIISYNDNQLIFNGKDILNSKSIDVSINSQLIKNDSDISKLVKDGIVLDFASNGNLPGKALARIKITEQMKNKFGNDVVHVYYYNEEYDKFNEIVTDIKSTNDGYYEFKIDHNSRYILVNEKLDAELLVDKDDNVVNFQKSDKVNLLLIGLGILLIIAVSVIIVFVKRNSKKEEK